MPTETTRITKNPFVGYVRTKLEEAREWLRGLTQNGILAVYAQPDRYAKASGTDRETVSDLSTRLNHLWIPNPQGGAVAVADRANYLKSYVGELGNAVILRCQLEQMLSAPLFGQLLQHFYETGFGSANYLAQTMDRLASNPNSIAQFTTNRDLILPSGIANTLTQIMQNIHSFGPARTSHFLSTFASWIRAEERLYRSFYVGGASEVSEGMRVGFVASLTEQHSTGRLHPPAILGDQLAYVPKSSGVAVVDLRTGKILPVHPDWNHVYAAAANETHLFGISEPLHSGNMSIMMQSTEFYQMPQTLPVSPERLEMFRGRNSQVIASSNYVVLNDRSSGLLKVFNYDGDEVPIRVPHLVMYVRPGVICRDQLVVIPATQENTVLHAYDLRNPNSTEPTHILVPPGYGDRHSEMFGLALSDDNTRFVGVTDNTLHLWSVNDGNFSYLGAFSGGGRGVAFFPNGLSFITWGGTFAGSWVDRYSLSGTREHLDFQELGLNGHVLGCRIAPEGNLIAWTDKEMVMFTGFVK